MNKTINYYDKNAKNYFDETININMQKSYDRFLKHIKGSYILDLGCGSGRDSKYFLDKGYKVKSVDGSREMCLLASKYLNREVDHLYFKDINYINEFDGIWACASLLHLSKKQLKNILEKMSLALKNNGYMYICLKNGKSEEYDDRGRFYSYYTKEEFYEIISLFKELDIIDFWYQKSNNEPKYWNNYIIKKHL